jgi:CRISPR type III-B/RAMP module RAMP protein Cmr1
MEKLLLSLKLRALYPLVGGYNRHSINEFYEESVRPTEIKGLWRWWNRVLFNTVSYVKEGKLYTYDSIDRLFEDVFGSENKKSAVRLEVITDEGSDNHFELSNVELDNVINCLKTNREEKVNLDFRDNTLIVEIEGSTKIPISFKSNLDIDKIKDLVYKNKLLSFELLGFKSIKIDTKISNKEVIKEILLDLITNYLEYFNIKQEVTFTLNIYLDKSRKHKQNFDAKLKFALHSLLVFILLGGIGRKTSRGFGGLSIVNAECHDGLCDEIYGIVNNMESEKEKKDLATVLPNIIFSQTIEQYFSELINNESYKLRSWNNNSDFFVYYFIKDINILRINRIDTNVNRNGIENILNRISNELSASGNCLKDLIMQEMRRRAFALAFLGNRKFRNIHEIYPRILEFLYANYIKREFVNLIGKERRLSNLRFKILEINNTYYIISYLLYSNYLKDPNSIIKDTLYQFARCVI